MAMYISARDLSLKRHIAREYINKVVSEEVIYYKISLSDTVYNIYGESKAKMYLQPVKLTCMVDRMPQTSEEVEYGTSTNRMMNFNFLKDDLIDLSLVPEKGDIITWNESYFEVDTVVEDQLLSGKDSNYSLSPGLEKYGASWSIICECHLAHVSRLNIIQAR